MLLKIIETAIFFGSAVYGGYVAGKDHRDMTPFGVILGLMFGGISAFLFDLIWR